LLPLTIVVLLYTKFNKKESFYFILLDFDNTNVQVTSAILLLVHNKRVHSLCLLITCFSLLDCIVIALQFSKFLYLSIRTEVLLRLVTPEVFLLAGLTLWLFECGLVFLCWNDCESFSLSKIFRWLIQTEVLFTIML